MARWHPDDLAGFLLANAPDEWTEVKLPAICTNPATDPLGRDLGEALWPERYPPAELERRKVAVSLALGSQIWDSQYQQDPRPRTGGMFPEDQWEYIVEGDVPADTVWCRGWDLAATEDASADFTAGVRLGLMPGGRVVIADVTKGQWSSDKVRTALTTTAGEDPARTHIELPQDPGQAGKDQAQQLVRLLAGHSVRALPQTGSKELRATPLSAQVLAGNVVLLRGPWNGAWIGEAASFPGGHHDDQVDAAATAYNALVRANRGNEVDEWEDDRLTGRR